MRRPPIPIVGLARTCDTGRRMHRARVAVFKSRGFASIWKDTAPRGEEASLTGMPSQDWLEANRANWRYRGQERPPFALPPRPGQESVWDYPRPPHLSPNSREVVVRLGSVEIARSSRTIRLLETASPPTFYIPPDDVTMNAIERAAGGSLCEWKGQAAY